MIEGNYYVFFPTMRSGDVEGMGEYRLDLNTILENVEISDEYDSVTADRLKALIFKLEKIVYDDRNLLLDKVQTHLMNEVAKHAMINFLSEEREGYTHLTDSKNKKIYIFH